MKICLIDETGTGDGALSVLAVRWGLEHDEDNLMALVLTPEHLELRKRDEPKLGGIFVDCIDSLEVRKKPGGHWIIRYLAGLDLVGLASL